MRISYQLFVGLTVCACTLLPCASVAAESPAAEPGAVLKSYVAARDASYQWSKRRESPLGVGSLVELTLTSQTWRDTAWKHQLFIYRPSTIKNGAQAVLLISGGEWHDSIQQPPLDASDQLPDEVVRLATLGELLQAPIVVLLQVPYQPLFEGMTEAEIISYTFEEFIKTSDVSWPLLLPMVKSVVRAMDTVQSFTNDEWQLKIESFVVTGASKRGWTTWLTAAVDSRVSAIAPMVINMLNMAPHMELQERSFGEISEKLRDYTSKGLQHYITSERGSLLRAIVDPYSYRHDVRQPKLIILGTNDRYFPVDALNLYWDELEGEKHILYVPNNGHGLRDYHRVVGTVAVLYASLNGGPEMPELKWRYVDQVSGTRLEVTSDVPPNSVTLWTAASDSRDFREAIWSPHVAKPDDDTTLSFTMEVPKSKHGFAAVFAEARFSGKSLPFYLSTELRVISADN